MRPFLASDLDAVAQVVASSIRAVPVGPYPETVLREWREGLDRGRLAELAGEHTSWVADQGGRVVGFASLHGDELGLLYVAGDQQRKGIGRRLLDAVLAGASARGLREVWLDASLNAVDVYLAWGFEDWGEVTRSTPQGDYRCHRMTRIVP